MNLYTTIKTLTGAVVMCGISVAANAAPLSPQQAMARVQSSQTIHRLPGDRSLVLAHTEKAGGENYLYVFNRGTSGFVIASADDRMPAVLGYSDNGMFDQAEASPELKWWLEQYAAQANSCLSSAIIPVNAVSKSPAQRPAVAELLKTRWNQAEPYNLDCPVENGYHCVTGCVATAMAQVIKYHGYPETGNGSHSYYWRGTELSYDYSAAHFDYANMPDVYDYYSDLNTEEQNKAVANLMYACGVAVNMDYGYGSSGSFDYMIAYALTEYFNYDKDIRFLKRACFSAEEWDEIVYGEVAAGRPVIYGGDSVEGGHEFVCDGYEDGYFHINWGWSGIGNGWFLLSALDPGLQGIGGFEGGYDYNQAIICGIQPDAGNPATTYPIIATGGLNPDNVYGSYVYLTFNGFILNYSPVDITTSLCLKAVSSTGEETVATGVGLTFPGASGGQLYGYTGLTMSIPAVGQGTYTVSLMYQGPDGNMQPVQIPLTGADHLNMTVDADGNISFSQVAPEQQPKIKVTQFQPTTEVLPAQETIFRISVENIGEYTYSGNIYVRAFQPDSEETLAEYAIGLAMNPGDVLSGYVGLSFFLPDGEYVLRFYDMYGEACSDDFPLTVGHPAVLATSITLDKPVIEATVGETVQLTATVLPDDTTDKTVAWSTSDASIATVDADGNVTIVANGTAIITASTTDGSDLHAECTVYGLTSIGAITRGDTTVDIYSTNGLLIRKDADAGYINTLAKGIYIIRTATGAYKIMK